MKRRDQCVPGILAAAAAAVAVASGIGCDGLQAAPAQTCSEAGAQCLLAKGPLGVCERTTCGEGASAPCFACTPQH